MYYVDIHFLFYPLSYSIHLFYLSFSSPLHSSFVSASHPLPNIPNHITLLASLLFYQILPFNHFGLSLITKRKKKKKCLMLLSNSSTYILFYFSCLSQNDHLFVTSDPRYLNLIKNLSHIASTLVFASPYNYL